jgi:translation initiation factor 2B subunit (eIF-2B alpha/beta/delta family)
MQQDNTDMSQILTAIAALTLELQNTSRAQQQQSFEMASALTNTNNQISSAQQNISSLQEAIQAINSNIQDLRSVGNPATRPPTPQVNLTLVRHTTESFRSDYKLISTFDGTVSLQEINDWASAVREYLELFPDLQLPLAKHFITSRLKGFARTWYQNHSRMVQKQQRIDFTTWPSLLQEIVQAALAGQNPNGPRNTFRELTQTSTVPDFVKEFNNSSCA